MITSTISSKGQITVPKEIRDQYKLGSKSVIDDEREKGKKRIVAREFCVFKFEK